MRLPPAGRQCCRLLRAARRSAPGRRGGSSRRGPVASELPAALRQSREPGLLGSPRPPPPVLSHPIPERGRPLLPVKRLRGAGERAHGDPWLAEGGGSHALGGPTDGGGGAGWCGVGGPPRVRLALLVLPQTSGRSSLGPPSLHAPQDSEVLPWLLAPQRALPLPGAGPQRGRGHLPFPTRFCPSAFSPSAAVVQGVCCPHPGPEPDTGSSPPWRALSLLCRLPCVLLGGPVVEL